MYLKYSEDRLTDCSLTSDVNYRGCYTTVGFWCQGIPQKFLQTFDTSFDTKMMVKSGAIEIISNPNGPGLTSFFGSISLAS